MTANIIPTSRDLVRLTREAWKLSKDDFGPKLGVSGEYAGRVENGHQVFPDSRVSAGCSNPDPDLRAFWLAYRSARRHEQDVAMIENCLENAAGLPE